MRSWSWWCRRAPSGAGERPAGAATAGSAPTVDVAPSQTDLDLIERGLKTLAYTPGYDYHLAPRIRALVDRLESAGHSLEAADRARVPEPVSTT